MKMSLRFTNKWQRTLFAVTATFLTAVVVAYATSQESHPHRQDTDSTESISQSIVAIQSQQDVPLHISSVTIDLASPLAPQLNFLVTNTSDKPLRAFTIRQEYIAEHTTGSVALLNHLTSLDKVLQPTTSMLLAVAGDTYSEPIKSITLSVDFVEFMDGKTWGPDTYKSAERLTGQRAGAHAAINHILKVKETYGLTAVANAITKGDVDIAPESGHSAEWDEGFRTGTAVIRERLRRAQSPGDQHQIEIELRKPYDASEGRQKQ